VEAGGLMAVASAILAFGLWPRSNQRDDSACLPLLPRAILWSSGLIVLLSILSSRTIFSTGYTSADHYVVGFAPGGIHALAYSVILYQCFVLARRGRISSGLGLGVMLAMCLLDGYLKGGSGFATGYLLTAGILYAGASRTRSFLSLLALCLLAFLGSALVRSARETVHEVGIAAAASSFWSGLTTVEAERRRSSLGVETLGNGTQYACHILECETLYDQGISREWRSLTDPIIFTLEPSFLLEPLGLERPIDSRWELARYFVHGGGNFLVGELYWNGGYLSLILLYALLVLYLWFAETRRASSFFWACGFFQAVPPLLMGYGYGSSQTARGMINGLLIFAGTLLYRAIARASRTEQRQEAFGRPAPILSQHQLR